MAFPLSRYYSAGGMKQPKTTTQADSFYDRMYTSRHLVYCVFYKGVHMKNGVWNFIQPEKPKAENFWRTITLAGNHPLLAN
jgi:hypothetical protein